MKHPHVIMLNELQKQLKPILEKSAQGVYIYLDDEHSVCNKKFAAMLGYKSPREWSEVDDPLEATFAHKSQNDVVAAYRNAVEKFTASAFNVTCKTKNGKELKTKFIIVPITFKGYSLALHFIEAI